MYVEYKDKGLEIVAFPCNQFLFQEPGSNQEIEKFAREKKGATFMLMSKIKVNGAETHPVYQFLRGKTNVAKIDWNFAKFLVSKDGKTIQHYSSGKNPWQLKEDIDSMLSE